MNTKSGSPPERNHAEAEQLRLGGMALHNGLLIHSPGYWAAAVRDDSGGISVASGKKRTPLGGRALDKYPLLRGVVRLADALAVLPEVKSKLGQAVLPIESSRVAATIGVTSLLTAVLRRGDGDSVLRQELSAVLLSLAPAVLALKNSSLAGYHGAEHRGIGEYERWIKGGEGRVAKEHDRCGSNLVGPLLATNLVGNVLMRRVRRRPGPVATLLTGLVSLGTAMEAFRWMSRHPESTLARAVSSPGYVLQKFLTTEEPTEGQMEVARAALREILEQEGRPWEEKASSASASSS